MGPMEGAASQISCVSHADVAVISEIKRSSSVAGNEERLAI
jgi:hypothetical protein